MARRPRVRVLDRQRRCGCGCTVPAGSVVVSTGPGKPWLCPAHQRQLPWRTVAEILEAAARD